MSKSVKTGFYFVLSAAAAAAAAMPTEDVAAACLTCSPGLVERTLGPALIDGYPGSSVMITELVVDDQYGFRSSTAPSAWFDWDPVDSTTRSYNVYACRYSGTGAAIACGVSNTGNTATTAHQEVGAILTGLYSTSNGPWDRYKLLGIIGGPPVSGKYLYNPFVPTRLPGGSIDDLA